MKLKGRSISLCTIMLEIFSFLYIVMAIDENGSVKKITTDNDEKAASKWIWKRESQCGLDTARMLNEIVKIYTQSEDVFCFVAKNETGNNCSDGIIEYFMKLGTNNVITIIPGARNFDMQDLIFQKPNGYILLSVDLPEVLETLIRFGEAGSTWNPRGLWISFAESKEDAARIMKSLWENFVYKVIVLVIRGITSDATEAYTWRPYYPYTYCGPPISRNLVRLGTFTETLKFEKETDLQPGIIPEKFRNCWINVSVTVFEPYVYPQEEFEKNQRVGIDLRLMKMIYDKIDLKFRSHYPTVELGSIENEARVGSQIPLSSDFGRWDVSQPYFEDTSTWILPRRGKSHGLEGMISRFSPALWGSTGVAMLVVAATLMAAGNRHWALNVWGSFWEQSADRLPRNTRRIWMWWLLLCLHLAAAYRTALVSLLTNPLMQHEISSVEELADYADLKLVMRIEGVAAFLDKNDETQMKILARFIPCEDIKKCFMEVPKGTAVLTSRMHANYLNTMENVTVSMLENIRHLTSRLTYKISMFYKKGHAVSPIFDKYMLMLIQAGFVEQLVRENEFLQKIIDVRKRDFTEKKPLSFADVREGFYLLAVGLTVAGLLFLYEMFRKFSRKRIPYQIDK